MRREEIKKKMGATKKPFMERINNYKDIRKQTSENEEGDNKESKKERKKERKKKEISDNKAKSLSTCPKISCTA
jgi:hypothetical protein